MIDFKEEIVRYLGTFCKGRRNAQPKMIIMEYLGIHDERVFRQMVHNLRISGIPILSRSQKPAGYYFPETILEAEEALRELNSRALNLHKTCKFLRRGLKKLFPSPQIELDLINEKEKTNDKINARG